MRASEVYREINNELGVTTVAVVAIVTMLIMLMSASILVVQANRVTIVHNIGHDEALNTAEGGINDYLWRINKDHEYYLNVVHPAQGNDGFGQPKWLAYGNGQYHLDITPPSGNVPMVTVKSTGRVKGPTGDYTTRSITTQMRMKSFTNYIYLTDNEYTEGGSDIIWWQTGDVVEGPLHTNDDLHTDGVPEFWKKVTMTGTLTKRNGTPNFHEGYTEHAEALDFPATNMELATYAKQGGYYYYGETTITLNGSTLNITNNDVSGKTTGPKGSGISFPGNGVLYVDGIVGTKWTAGCGDAYVQGTYHGKLTIGAKNIIWVTGNTRYTSATDDILGLVGENYVLINHYNKSAGDITLQGRLNAAVSSKLLNGTVLKSGTTCTNVNDKTAIGGTWTGTGPYTLSTNKTLSSDRTFQGTLDAAATSVLKTNSILRTGTTCVNLTDSTEIGGTWTGSGPYTLSGDKTITGDVALYNIEIDAAVAAVNHSFGFERYAEGVKEGTLRVVGSMTQRYRGPVGTFGGGGGTGYTKDYVYDERMAYLRPPRFIEPANSGFEIITWNESS